MANYTDSSLTGWGAACDGEITRGHWSADENQQHINYLELLAAFMGLKSFCQNCQDINILLRIDNTTTISYINRMGGIQYPHQITREIWHIIHTYRKIYLFSLHT